MVTSGLRQLCVVSASLMIGVTLPLLPARAALVLAIVLTAFLWLWVRGRARHAELAERLENNLCPNCGYDLQGVPHRRRCSECGHDLDETLV